MPKIAAGLLVVIGWAGLAGAAEPTPEPFVRMVTSSGGEALEDGAELTIRPGEKLRIEAAVYGGRRAWCMEPQRYANLGRNTAILSNSDRHLSFTTGSGFRGDWQLKSETASWWGSLGDHLEGDAGSNTATLTGPRQEGRYVLTIKAAATWGYVRLAQGMKRAKEEENLAEATFTIVVAAVADAWFSSANIVATGDEDEDLRFRLQRLQELWDVTERQALDGDYDLARRNLGQLGEVMRGICTRLEKLEREEPEYACTITLNGLPTDRAAVCLQAFEQLGNGLKEAVATSSENALKINEMLLQKQMVFTGNVLRSVFKNYLDWAVGLPDLGDAYDGANTLLGLTALGDVALPLDLMQWYTTAMGDAAILRDQAQSMQRMKKLLAFYEGVRDRQLEIRRQVSKAIEANRPVAALDKEYQSVISGAEWAVWLPRDP